MRDEWRYVINSRDCHVNMDGDVIQNDTLIEPYLSARGSLCVELMLETEDYDREIGQWIRVPQEVDVARLVVDAWFTKWPRGGEICFLDGDKTNCSADNLRALVLDRRTGLDKVIHVREEEWGFVFDLRLKGSVEILETGEICSGVAEAARRVSGDVSNVSLVLSGRLETHRGFHFRWV